MNKNVSKFIEEVLLESALDVRIDDGIIDLTNAQHLEVIHEVLQSKGLEETGIDELFETILAQEGKYPERQAYNKDGWLVTFPSKEYRDAALKKGSHFTSDPTHGKGGMNLYYKKRGKQKRQTRQQTTAVVAPQQNLVPPPPASTQATDAKPDGSKVNQPAVQQQAPAKPAPTKQKKQLPPDEGEPLSNADIEKISQDAIQTYQKKAPQAPVQQAPAIADTPAQIQVHQVAVKKNITEKFAQNKGWTPTQFGEWRDSSGQTKAVVSLSGEVAPINANEREELKLFAEKSMA